MSESDSPSGKRGTERIMVATIAVMGLVALYVLSTGPFSFLHAVLGEPDWLGKVGRAVYYPLILLVHASDSTAFAGAFNEYLDWWRELAR